MFCVFLQSKLRKFSCVPSRINFIRLNRFLQKTVGFSWDFPIDVFDRVSVPISNEFPLQSRIVSTNFCRKFFSFFRHRTRFCVSEEIFFDVGDAFDSEMPFSSKVSNELIDSRKVSVARAAHWLVQVPQEVGVLDWNVTKKFF